MNIRYTKLDCLQFDECHGIFKVTSERVTELKLSDTLHSVFTQKFSRSSASE